MVSDMRGLDLVGTKPAIRITAGDIAAPTVCVVDVALFGGHMDGLTVSKVEVPMIWPVITTLERWHGRAQDDQDEIVFAFIPRNYKICLCEGRVRLDRGRRVRYCLEEN